MRNIERKVYEKIKESGSTFDDIWEIVDRFPQQEMKKSYPDECHFHNDKYFTKIIIDALLRYKMIRQDGNKFFKNEKKDEKEKQ